jgi:hypothetical protein
MYFVSMHRNRKIKSFEIVLRRKGRRERMMERVNTMIYFKHICEYHKISP